MKLSEYAYKCSINPPKNNFGWKQLLNVVLGNIRKGNKTAINSLLKSYEDKELANNIVDYIINCDNQEFKEFKDELYLKNEEILSQNSGKIENTNNDIFMKFVLSKYKKWNREGYNFVEKDLKILSKFFEIAKDMIISNKKFFGSSFEPNFEKICSDLDDEFNLNKLNIYGMDGIIDEDFCNFLNKNFKLKLKLELY